MKPYYEHAGIQIFCGDCREILPNLLQVDAVVTDPPYGLEFMGKQWDAPWKTDRRQLFDGTLKDSRNSPFVRSKVRNGTTVSYGAKTETMQALQAWHHSWATECLRILKPGGHLLAFGGARTYHRLASAIEDAGFEIRDQIMWIYGSGFPKSLDVSKAIDRAAGAKREEIGPAPYTRGKASQAYSETRKVSYDYPPQPLTAPATDAAKQWQGWGTALKPAHEPIVVARKPLDGTIVENVLRHGTGAIHIDACRIEYEETPNAATNPLYRVQNNYAVKVGSDSAGSSFSIKPEGGEVTANFQGRWPANVIHDGSDEVLALFPYTSSGTMKAGTIRAAQDHPGSVCYGTYGGNATEIDIYADHGSAARFFYCAKADRSERDQNLEGSIRNDHPTVKPIDLMRYLCQLVTPPNGIVLDCFAGSGTTLVAAKNLGLKAIGIEIEERYCEIAAKRLAQDTFDFVQ